MARYIHQGWFFDGNGKLVGGATISVFLTGTVTPVSIYSLAAGGTAVNSVTSSTTDGSWYFYVDSADYSLDQKFDVTISKSGFTSKTLSNVVIFPGINYEIGTLEDSATPSVLAYSIFHTGGTTTITNFTNGAQGKIIRILSDHTITITDGTNIFLNGSANFTMSATDTLTLILNDDGKWYELSRSDNT
jgi:hypothetical protein